MLYYTIIEILTNKFSFLSTKFMLLNATEHSKFITKNDACALN